MISDDSDRRDIADAEEYMHETFEAEGPWIEQKRKSMPLREILDWDDYSSWGEWRSGDLRGLTEEELRAELRSFRGKTWAEIAIGWLVDNRIPAIILAEARDGTSAIADGRGRVSLAVGLGIPSLPVIIVAEQR